MPIPRIDDVDLSILDLPPRAPAEGYCGACGCAFHGLCEGCGGIMEQGEPLGCTTITRVGEYACDRCGKSGPEGARCVEVQSVPESLPGGAGWMKRVRCTGTHAVARALYKGHGHPRCVVR